MKVILETDRLLLREYVEEDAEAFFKLNSDPEVLRFVPDKPLLNVEQARQILVDHPIADYMTTHKTGKILFDDSSNSSMF
jgi:ribosomal-protein-alanine N-acetyltransferase